MRMHRLSVLLFTPLVAIGFTMGCGDSTAPTDAAKLAFIALPTSATAGEALTPPTQVEIQDASGARDTTARSAVTLSLSANPSGAVLAGATTVNAVNGVATFNGLWISKEGAGYAFVASMGPVAGTAGIPVTVSPATATFARVTAGADHTCGVKAAGAVYCWGDNYAGQLGDGTRTPRLRPVLIAGGMSFAAVSAGAFHTCAVTALGAAYCWGANGMGALGDGTHTDRLSPALVAGGMTFIAVSGGLYHTCGVTAAGAAYCWGYNGDGMLGDGTTTNRSSPVLVAGGVSFAAVSAGHDHTCALSAAGATYCWGHNVNHPGPDMIPALVPGEQMSFIKVSSGANHTCGVTVSGAAYCWGMNGYGQVGNGPTLLFGSPYPVAGGLTFAALSSGHAHTCGITTAGAAYCWGRNDLDQLGDGTNTQRPSPVLVTGGESFASLSAGGARTCGLTAGGAAYCWGIQRLGDGTITASSTPVRVLPP